MKVPHIRKAVVDTSFLYDALLINYTFIQKKKDSFFKYADSICGKNEIYKKNYIEFLSKIDCFVTTSHAIGELRSLVKHRTEINGDLECSFWEISTLYLKSKKIDEQLIKLLSISEIESYSKFIYEIGYVDTGLIELAKKEFISIITKDNRTLAGKARHQLVNVYVTSDFLKIKS